MPLKHWQRGMSRAERERVIGYNAAVEMKHGKPRKQALAIAYHAAGEKKQRVNRRT